MAKSSLEYSVNSGPRYCIFICNMNFSTSRKRPEAKDEIDKINKVFKEQLGFCVEYYPDKKVEDMKEILKNISEYYKNIPPSCFVLIFSSHGSNGKIYGCDDNFITYKEINACLDIPLLKDVPKVLYLSACRIEKDDNCDLFESFNIPDMVMLAVPFGELGKRTVYTGSRLLNSVYEVYLKNKDIDVMSLAVDINDHLYKYKQNDQEEQKVVCFSTLKKRLILSKM